MNQPPVGCAELPSFGAGGLQQVATMEAAFTSRRNHEPDLSGAVAAAFASLGGTSDVTDLARAGASIAQAMDAIAQARPEPAYHNRHHAAEATLAMAWLCRLAREQGLLSDRQAAIGVAAMVGHDMHHDGSTITGGVLEARSKAAVEPIAAAAGLDLETIGILGDIILATDLAHVADNAARGTGRAPAGPRGQSHDVLRLLANEADVSASLLPRLGPALGVALAEERRPAGNPALLRVATASGRLAFLQGYPVLSDMAVAIGLQHARMSCIAAYVAAASMLGVEATAEAGCAALDQLEPGQARRIYDAALAAVAQP